MNIKNFHGHRPALHKIHTKGERESKSDHDTTSSSTYWNL